MNIETGIKVTCIITSSYGKNIIKDCKIQKQRDYYYLCQNIADGVRCEDTLGYKYSWLIGFGNDIDLKHYKVGDFKILDQDWDKENNEY